ncbi:hypothetical protein [Parvibacter caecicola]|uniref:Uncharacterized protein n=1 Tax=Parvibacter caecicola TaxID=747645 RepID=A0A7W5D180_9ACTN|nr:hypothetical protein [Parvibacter caecicola]MBB3171019.1 hypothetical protein [Parvibacter caecicola]MCR2042186.1 hypothetical protein [Parvibacter caecicola]RNL10947.1 hypothetical protein DMP11_05785 [Parvibacter caecicola]
MECFNGNSSYSIFENLKARLKEDISELKAEELDSTDRDAWVDYWENEYYCPPVELYPDNAELGLTQQSVQQYNSWHHAAWDEPEYFEVEGARATCKVPYSGTPWFFKMQPSTFTLSGHYAEKVTDPGSDGFGYITFALETPLGSATPEGIRKFFSDQIEDFSEQIECCNKDAESYNNSLRQIIEAALDKRIEQLDKFASLRRGLNLPLNRVKDAPLAMPLHLQKKTLKVSRPEKIPSAEQSYSIDDATYKHITDVIESSGAMMERAPEAYNGMEEEHLRDVLLSALNTHYQDQVNGEAFRRHGKTDIQIPVNNHAAYIAECKLWKGPKAFKDALAQLFSYTTWRDTKVSVIVFNKKNKNYEKVLDAIDEVLEGESITCDRHKHSQWLCKIQNEEDERIMHVTVQVFDLSL